MAHLWGEMLVWLKDFQIFSAQDGLIDFLSVCFAIDTMLSFSKIQNQLSMWIRCGMEKELNQIKPVATDCSRRLQSCGVDEARFQSEQLKKLIGYQEEFIKKKDVVCRIIKTWLIISKCVFSAFAVLCVMGILVSQEPLLLSHPFRVAIFGLGPAVIFFISYIIVGCWVLLCVFPLCKKKKKATVESFNNVQDIVNQVTEAIKNNQK